MNEGRSNKNSGFDVADKEALVAKIAALVVAQERDLVITQLSGASPGLKLFIGENSYNRNQIIEHVRNLDEMGREFVATQINYLHAWTSGEMEQTLRAMFSAN